MSAISGYISTIQNAVYGEQVRTAIVNALTQCYSDVSNPSLNTAAFSAAIEAAYAGGFLDIQEKSTIAGMTNTSIIYRYTGNEAGQVHNALYYYDGTAWQAIAKQESLDLILEGVTVFRNLFNKNDSGIATSSYINSSGAVVSASSSDYSVSGYIPVTKGNYCVHCSQSYNYVAYYDASKQLLSAEQKTNRTDANGRNYIKVDVVSAKYIRFTFYAPYINQVMAVRNDTMPSVYAAYNTVGVQLSGSEATTQTVELEMEGGSIFDSPLTGADSTTIDSFNTRHRTKYYLQTGGAGLMSLDLGDNNVSAVYIAKFDQNRDLIENLTAVSDINNIVIGTASYVRFVLILSNSNDYFYPITATLHGTDGTARQVKKPRYNSSSFNILYPLSKDICNTGILKLPSNYNPDGEAVPLVVFMHGSGNFANWTNSEMADYAYLNYVRDSGFAVVEFYSWTSKYFNKYGANLKGCDPYPVKITLDAYREGIKYICDCWNVDINNIHIMSKSQGGQLAYHYANYSPFPLRSIGMFSPVLDYLSMRGASGNGQSFGDPRRAIVEELDLTGDAENNFVSTLIYASNCVTFLQANLAKLNSINEAWQGLIGQTMQEKFDTAIDNCEKWWSNKTRNDVYTDTDLAKLGKYPVKIWGTPTDSDTPYQKMVETVAQLNNGGCEAHLRTFESGGHNVTDSNASTAGAVTTNVTTRLGIEYASIPTAYYEAVEWMLSKMNEPFQESS